MLVEGAKGNMPSHFGGVEKQKFLQSKLIQWLSYIDLYVAGGRVYGDDKILAVLKDSFRYTSSLNVFASLRLI